MGFEKQESSSQLHPHPEVRAPSLASKAALTRSLPDPAQISLFHLTVAHLPPLPTPSYPAAPPSHPPSPPTPFQTTSPSTGRHHSPRRKMPSRPPPSLCGVVVSAGKMMKAVKVRTAKQVYNSFLRKVPPQFPSPSPHPPPFPTPPFPPSFRPQPTP